MTTSAAKPALSMEVGGGRLGPRRRQPCPVLGWLRFSPAAADLVLFVRAELSAEIEIVTVTGAAELQFTVTLGPAARSVSGIATNTLGRPVLWPKRSVTGPAAGKLGERA